MTTASQKKEIVESLNDLDAVQSEKVLEFIRTLHESRQGVAKQEIGHRKVMKEINQALTQARLWV